MKRMTFLPDWKSGLRLVLLAAGVAFVAGTALGQSSVPNLINFQGKLTDNLGNPVADGPHNFTFRIFDGPEGGSILLWREGPLAISTAAGLFNHQLGSSTALPQTLFLDYDSLYLEIEADAEIQSPRTRLISNPYTRVANGLEVRSTTYPDTVAIRTDPSNHRFSIYGSDGKENVRAGGFAFGEISLFDVDINDPSANRLTAILRAQPASDNAGGELQLRDALGNTVIKLHAAIGAGDAEVAFPNGSINSAEILDNSVSAADIATDAVGTTEIATGAVGSTEIATGAVGSSEVAFNSLLAGDLFDEPGVASNTQAGSTILDGTVQTLLSRTITMPASGWVLAIGTCYAFTLSPPGSAGFGVSSVAGVFPANQGGSNTIDNEENITVHGLFSVAAGANTFYFLAEEFSSSISVSKIQFTLVYFPSSYGTVTPTVASSPQDLSDEKARIRTAFTAEEIAAEQAEAEKFDAERIARELAEVKARMQKIEEHLRQNRKGIDD
ncbi:MAG: hypothetical protein ACRECJ_02760 [Limisphaerales bacterium]